MYTSTPLGADGVKMFKARRGVISFAEADTWGSSHPKTVSSPGSRRPTFETLRWRNRDGDETAEKAFAFGLWKAF